MTDLANVQIQYLTMIHNNQVLWVPSRSMMDCVRDRSVSSLSLAPNSNCQQILFVDSCWNLLLHPLRKHIVYNNRNIPSRKRTFQVHIGNDHYSIRVV